MGLFQRAVRSQGDILSADYEGDNVATAYEDILETQSGISTASVESSDSSMSALREWFGDVFYKTVQEEEHWEGTYGTYLRESTGYAYTLKEVPVDMTRTVTRSVLDVQSCISAVFILLLFVTAVTWMRKAVFGR